MYVVIRASSKLAMDDHTDPFSRPADQVEMSKILRLTMRNMSHTHAPLVQPLRYREYQ